MIDITNKENCCGCSACVQVCPKHCINFKEGDYGFRYPSVNADNCISCGMCEKVCPCKNQLMPHKPDHVFAAINSKEEIRMNSSSGGLFSAIAEEVLEQGGVVFGARFNEEWEVEHDYTENKEGLVYFQGSKYVQSQIQHSYIKARDFLNEGRKVLFSGTPCQIAGLKGFLRKKYTNLLTIDVVCHGVPSPLIWKDYLTSINPSNDKITHLNMRDKSRGWTKYSYLIRSNEKDLYNDYAANSPYLQAFISNLSLRPSCFNCPAKLGRSGSDLTLADCWGFEELCPEMFDNRGISAILINTPIGSKVFEKLDVPKKEISCESFFHYNPSYGESSIRPKLYDIFWELYKSHNIESISIVRKKMSVSLLRRIVNKIKKIIRL